MSVDDEARIFAETSDLWDKERWRDKIDFVLGILDLC